MMIRNLCIVGAALLALAGCKDKKAARGPGGDANAASPTTAALPPAPEVPTDIDITRAIERELLYDGAVRADQVMVITTDGIVSLTGEVDSLLARERAARIAATVRGVRTISNRLVVAASDRPDADIAGEIRRAWMFDPAADSYQISVAVADGEATLTGKVELFQEKELAARLASKVRGVTRVDNQIRVDLSADVRDIDIRTSAESRLRWDPLIHEGLLSVRVVDGDVTVEGTVGSLAQRDRVINDVWVRGVRSVNADAVEVVWWLKAPELRQGSAVRPSDADIRAAILDAAFYDPRVRGYDLAPRVEDGVVTLEGRVTSLAAKRAAGQLARNTQGVIDVRNQIAVAPPEAISDETLVERIKRGLAANPITESYEVEVIVSDGVATLKGTVDSFYEAAEAEDVAMAFIGIGRVDNQLAVEQPVHALFYGAGTDPYFADPFTWKHYLPTTTSVSDSAIERRIEREILWDPTVNARGIGVEVVNGKAILTGTVHSLAEALEAEEEAYEGGAVAVDNQLEIF